MDGQRDEQNDDDDDELGFHLARLAKVQKKLIV